MLCSKFKHFVVTKSTLHNNVQFRCFITSRVAFRKWVWIDGILATATRKENSVMSPLKVLLKDLRVWSRWTRNGLLSTVVRKCRRDRGVREVIQCFRQAFFRPRRTLLISATAAYKARCDDDQDNPKPCNRSITDLELQELLNDLKAVEILSQRTLFCHSCGKRLVINKKQPGVPYCSCQMSEKNTEQPQLSSEGWEPYIEAEDVIIWRKEFKPGLGQYAYKVYGRYPEIRAADFAAVQVDGAYRLVWDRAVAALAVVERSANGVADQAVLHWEVLWPRLFANRDYVYIRRHKEFEVTDKGGPRVDGLFQPASTDIRVEPIYAERPSVHSNAKRKAKEAYARAAEANSSTCNKVYVIINRSCEHPSVPETKHAIRVSEYWSHMVVKTINGGDKSGMEFVLTYYDDPSGGGMPSTVAAWATGRAAPAYLQRMRRAALDYRAWRHATQQEIPDFTPFASTQSDTNRESKSDERRNDPYMESTQEGPDIGVMPDAETRDQSTQTEDSTAKVKVKHQKVTEDKSVETDKENKVDPQEAGDLPKALDDEDSKNGGWWRYLHPFYYFV